MRRSVPGLFSADYSELWENSTEIPLKCCWYNYNLILFTPLSKSSSWKSNWGEREYHHHHPIHRDYVWQIQNSLPYIFLVFSFPLSAGLSMMTKYFTILRVFHFSMDSHFVITGSPIFILFLIHWSGFVQDRQSLYLKVFFFFQIKCFLLLNKWIGDFDLLHVSFKLHSSIFPNLIRKNSGNALIALKVSANQ
jgi:hypothetical protein